MTTTSTDRPLIGDDELAARLGRLRDRMAAAGVEAGIAYGTPHLPGDVQYLTGYDPQLESAAVVVTSGDILVVGGPEGEVMFADQGRLGEWRNLDAFKIPGQHYDGTRFWTLVELLEDASGQLPARVATLSAPDVLPWSITRALQAVGVELDDRSGLLRELRYRKTETELTMFRIASTIATEAMEAMLAAVAPGVTELEVAAAGDAVVKRLGAYGYGFDTIVCSGPRINTIIGRAQQRRIEDGDIVMLGVSPRYEGYCSALGRTVVAGTATDEQRAFLAHGARAAKLAADALAPGRPAREVDLAARRYLEQHGLGAYHAYGVGHGIGLSECLEDRTATAISDYELPTGIAMMLDVGLFGHPRFFGSRHEDPFLVDHDGRVERLTTLPIDA